MNMNCSKCEGRWNEDASHCTPVKICPFCHEKLDDASTWQYFDNTKELLAFAVAKYGDDLLFIKKYLSDHSIPLMPIAQKNLVKQAYDCGAVKILQDNANSNQAEKEIAIKQAIGKMVDTYATANFFAERVIHEFTDALNWGENIPLKNLQQSEEEIAIIKAKRIHNEYELSNDKKSIVIVKYNVKNAAGKIVVPNYIEGLPVDEIAENAFWGCTFLKEIVLPDGVTSIGRGAFWGCTSLKEIVLPDGVISISNKAFRGCTSLAKIVIPDSVISIGVTAFWGCKSLKEIVIPDSVTSIDGGAFWDCTLLKEIVIPNGVTSIGKYAFYNCESLMEIIIPDSITYIGNSAFFACRSLTEIVIPDGVTSIGEYAFCDCTALEKIVVPDGVTYIGEWAFRGCKSLTKKSKEQVKRVNPKALI